MSEGAPPIGTTIGSEKWEAWVERVIKERDEALAVATRLRNEIEQMKSADRVAGLEGTAELTNLRRAAGDLTRVCRNIINNPLTGRRDVQSKLTLAMQAFEREMGEGWSG